MTPLFRRHAHQRPGKHRHDRDASEATKARKAAEVELERVKAETPFFAALGKSLRDLREENHFRASFEATFRGGRT